jgi:uncharacterized phiE125 gp8 family phage protein
MILISLKNISNDLDSDPLISLDIVKSYLKIEHKIEDELLNILTYSAINQCEAYTSLSLSKKNWVATYEAMREIQEIILPTRPVVNIASIEKYNSSGEKSTVVQNTYYLFEDRLIFKDAKVFTRMSIVFKAGYEKGHLPAELKSILLEHIADMYEKRNNSAGCPKSKYKKFRRMRL